VDALSPSDALARLQRLESYLREDPRNGALLADACDAALAAGQHESALAHVREAQRLGLDPVAWTFRQARVCLARRDLDAADDLLQRLAAQTGDHPVLAHDRAYVRLLQQDFAGCRALLQPWLQERAAAVAAGDLQALQLLWLRATHALGLVQEARDWLAQAVQQGPLPPALLALASLIAVDADDFEAARALADAALAALPGQPEALVARATVALAEGDAAAARDLLLPALERNAEDGRTWATLGLASLQAQELVAAQRQLERAVALMPGHIGTWHALGWTRLLRQDRAGAGQAFAQALALDRNFAESHGAVGLVLALRGDGDAARRHLELAARLDARNVTGRYAQALLAGQASDAGRLQQLAARLLDRPGFFGASLGEAYRRGATPRH
jgi:Flp pilus assembly protein TadD